MSSVVVIIVVVDVVVVVLLVVNVFVVEVVVVDVVIVVVEVVGCAASVLCLSLTKQAPPRYYFLSYFLENPSQTGYLSDIHHQWLV